MIKIERYSRNMYVVRGDTSKYKNKLKSFGMKFTHNLTCGSGYILRIRCKNDLYILKKLKKYISNVNEKVSNEPECAMSTNINSCIFLLYILADFIYDIKFKISAFVIQTINGTNKNGSTKFVL